MASPNADILSLSDEILLKIFGLLDMASLSQVQKISPRLQELCKDQALASDTKVSLRWQYSNRVRQAFTMKVNNPRFL